MTIELHAAHPATIADSQARGRRVISESKPMKGAA